MAAAVASGRGTQEQTHSCLDGERAILQEMGFCSCLINMLETPKETESSLSSSQSILNPVILIHRVVKCLPVCLVV